MNDIPQQTGKLAIVTGATGGIGYETALALAVAGAEVVIAARSREKGERAIQQIRQIAPMANVYFELIDLGSLVSIQRFREKLAAQKRPVDLLINNAGVLAPPKRLVTRDGFELQFGVNFLGHFALTGLLLPLFRKAKAPRVVNISSIAAHNAAINFSDLQSELGYSATAAYCQSKLANLLFSSELQRQSNLRGWGLASISAHPGIVRTDIFYKEAGRRSLLGLSRTFLWFLYQPADQGALPALFAGTSPAAKAGAYYGPNRMNGMRGSPVVAKIPSRALDVSVAERLWNAASKLTGVAFD